MENFNKEKIQRNILKYMEEHPLPQGISRMEMFKYSLASLLLASVVGGSTVLAAEKSLPGDMLYPVKIHITEPLQDALAVTSSDKAKRESMKIERRIGEAQALSKKDSLDDSKAKDLERKIEKHMRSFKSFTEETKKEGKEKEALKETEKLENRLTDHAKTFERLREGRSESHKEEVRKIEEKVKEKKEELRNERKEAEERLKGGKNDSKGRKH